MKELSPFAKELVESGKNATDPTAADQARNLAAIQARLDSGATGGPGEPAVTDPPPATHAAWKLATGAAVGGGVLAGLLYFSSEAPPPEDTPEDPSVMVDEQSVPPTGGDTKSEMDAQLPLEASDADTAGPAAEPPTSDDGTKEGSQTGAAEKKTATTTPRSRELAEEVALLSKATSALRSGRGQAALKFTSEHQERFPRGALTQERKSARAQAFCLLGRKDEARSALRGLSASSPLGARARRACGFDK